MRKTLKLITVACGLALAATTGLAQSTSNNKVSEKTDWSVFVDQNPTECWSVSQPKESVNTRNGRVVSVKRGDILLFVFFRPSEKVDGQVTFTGGYPFAPDSRVKLAIDGNSYELPAIQGEWAWAASPEDDAKIIAAMKRGANAVLTARSERGTTTKDKFSLTGFTAAYDDSKKRCSN